MSGHGEQLPTNTLHAADTEPLGDFKDTVKAKH